MAYDLCIRNEVTGRSLPLVHYNDAGEKEYIHQETLDKIKTIGAYGMRARMRYCNASMQNVSFPQLTSVGPSGLLEAFRDCIGLASVSFPQLKSVGYNGLGYAFYGCTGLTGVSFPQLTTADGSGLINVCEGCTGLTSVSFPQLASVGDYGLSYAFSNCTGLTSVSFPQLKSVGYGGLSSAFYGAGVTSLHFRRDAQAVIQAQEDYASHFGAYDATIYFDL